MPKAKQKQPATPVEVIGKSKPKLTPVEPVSKQQILITLLTRPQGATLEELIEATGWQRHSVRGTLSGVLKKRLGLPVADPIRGGPEFEGLVDNCLRN